MYQLLLVFLATLFYIDIFSNHYFLDLSYSTPSSRLWGKPCTVSSTSHSPSYQYQFNHLLLVSFRLHYSPACTSSEFSTSSTFSPGTFFWIFHMRQLGSLPHQVLLFTLFFCWNVHSSSFCTEGLVAIFILFKK